LSTLAPTITYFPTKVQVLKRGEVNFLTKTFLTLAQWLMPVIPATEEVQLRRIVV
jgi:hypothetical protein